MATAVIFDLDGLMADSEPLAEWAWAQVLARYGCQLDDETLQEILGLRVIDSAAHLCRRYQLPLTPEEAAAERDRLFLAAVPAQLSACLGLYPLLDDLETRGVPLGVATSGHQQYVSLALRTLGVAGRFQAIATGDQVARGKPAPDIYLLAARQLDIPPHDCLALEDAPLGVAAAQAAGMTCIAVPNPRLPPTKFSRADRVLTSLQEVHTALDDLLTMSKPEEI